jgi:hypothetical protein
VDKELVKALSEAGPVISLIIGSVISLRFLIVFATFAVNKWSEAAMERNKIETQKAEADKDLAESLALIATQMTSVNTTQHQIALTLELLSSGQTALDRDMKASFKQAGDQVTADGTQTRAELSTGFGKVGEGVDELKRDLQEAEARHDEQYAEISANMTDMQQKLDVLLERTVTPPDVRDQLVRLRGMMDKVLTGVQTLMARADVPESAEPRPQAEAPRAQDAAPGEDAPRGAGEGR